MDTIVSGIQSMVTDLRGYLMVIAPVVTGIWIAWNLFCKSTADEMDHKKYNGRIKWGIIGCIGVMAAATLIEWIMGYFSF